MKIEASKRTHVSVQKALTAAVETAIIIPEISEGDSRIRCPGVCASRLYFLLHFHNRSFESVRGCHAPVLGRQGTAEMRRRAPTYRERWVKNDDSGTLGFLFFQNQNAVQSGTAFSFYKKDCQANNTDISRIKRSICARRFPKGDRKALWWGDGAKPHIPKCLDSCFLKCSV